MPLFSKIFKKEELDMTAQSAGNPERRSTSALARSALALGIPAVPALSRVGTPSASATTPVPPKPEIASVPPKASEGPPIAHVASAPVLWASHDLTRPQNPTAPATPQATPSVQTPAPPAGNEYEKVIQVPTAQQNPPALLGKAKAVGNTALRGLVVVSEGLKQCSDFCPPLKIAAAAFLTLHKIFEGASVNEEELEGLVERLDAILSLVQRYKNEGGLDVLGERVQSFSTAIERLVKATQDSQNRYLVNRIAEVSNDAGTMQAMLKSLNSACDLFLIDIQFPANVTVQDTPQILEPEHNQGMFQGAHDFVINRPTMVNNQHIYINTSQMLKADLIDKLRSEGASYETRHSAYGDPKGCMPGTRVNVLKELEAQASDEKGVKVHWLAGMAGIGKSTIAQSLCERFEQRQMLGASFFCSRASEKTKDARRIIPGIAYGLARGSPTFNAGLAKAMKDPDLLESNDMQKQFDKLIAEPLRAAVGGRVGVYKIVVIDALDECTNLNLVHRLIRVILSSTSDLPLKFFLVSRADHSITTAFNSSKGSHNTFLLHEVEKSVVESDIRMYVKASLDDIKRNCDPDKEDGWPPDSELSQIVKDSGKLFVYAATAVRYIRAGEGNYKQRLTLLTKPTKTQQQTSPIDELYGGIVTQACNQREEEELSQMETLVSFVIFLQQPLSLKALSALSKIPEPKTHLSPFSSVVHIPSDESAPVSAFHASFPEFLTDRKRCPPERFSPFTPLLPTRGHAELTLKCLELMNGLLKYNICDVPKELTLSRRDRTNPPEDAVKIPEALKYACIYWATHLNEVQDSSMPVVIDALRNFLKTHLLHWMECLSIVGELKTGLKSLVSASAALSRIQMRDAEDLRPLVDDARRFLQLSFDRIQKHCFEVYQSAFTWIPKKSLMRQIYNKRMGLQSIVMGLPDSWGPLEHCMSGGSVIDSVAFSPDGARVASGSDDGTVRIWNAGTGEEAARLEGHTNSVTSVAFSPDGARVASGSDDGTVRIWNAGTGEEAARLEGHTDSVTSVAFSPDGARVASGSDDRTVRIWNAGTGEEAARLEGHMDSVTSVAFSPDGARVASGSHDRTVRIWNAGTGEEAARLEGHTNWVTSVAFSPDGARVASGSDDGTVRIWNAGTGEEAARLEGHTDSVTSVAFSPDGARVASGSWDRTVRIWNAGTGEEAARLEGHTNWVTSVAFSPDGARVASGSRDRTVRIWNAGTGEEAARLKGHTDSVTSVAFSPDGARVASGSWDRTVRIWNAGTGEEAARLEGHTNWVTSVAFSPDGARVASGSDDGTVRIWNAGTGEEAARLEGHTDSVTSVAFSPDGARVASASHDRTVRIWNAGTGEEAARWEGHTNSVTSVAFSPDGARVALGSRDWTVRIWNAGTGEEAARLEGHTDSVTSVAFSPDGARVALGSRDRTVRIWNAGTGEEAARLEGHTNWVTSVAFSPDGARVASASHDRTVRIWNAGTGEEAAQLGGHTDSV